MAGYNKEKLLKMIEQRRQAHVALRDLSDRRLDARQDARSQRANILAGAAWRAQNNGVVARLLDLPTMAALALSDDEIRLYDVGGGVKLGTEIDVAAYRRYLAARDCFQRLDGEYEKASNDFQVRFGVVTRLVEAVKAWGFSDPELEVY